MKITIAASAFFSLVLLGMVLLMGAVAADEDTYGRAGGRVGHVAIAQVVREARAARTMLTQESMTIHGQAGQPVGADAIEHVSRNARRSTGEGRQTNASFGRAGSAVGIDRVLDAGSGPLSVAER